MKVQLERTVNVDHFAVFAELGWFTRRPELGALCRAAAEQGGVMTSDVIGEVLPGIPARAISNLERMCSTLGLCERGGALTDLGHEVAETGLAPIPEQGVYEVWSVDDQLAGARWLHLTRRVAGSRTPGAERSPLPAHVDNGQTVTSLVDPDATIVLRRFPHNHLQRDDTVDCARLGSGQVTLRWTWDMDREDNRWHLSGAIKGAPLAHAAESTPAHLHSLFGQVARQANTDLQGWNTTTRRLAVEPEDISVDALQSFHTSRNCSEVVVPGFGTFGQMHVTDIALEPASANAAQRWAEQLFWMALNSAPPFATPRELGGLWASIVLDSPLEPHLPRMPEHDAMLATLEGLPERFWGLAAARDLSPSPWREGSALSPQAPSRVASARHDLMIPLGSTRSMLEVARALLDGVTPTRLVLCDRWVRGNENLAALEMLCASFQALGVQPPLEVVTGEHGSENDAAIAEITGVRPRAYDEVFGGARRTQPHDRYLLVVNGHARFAWQMSNSPLDGRVSRSAQADAAHTPETLLRWRDLSATRPAVEQLPTPLQSMLGGAR